MEGRQVKDEGGGDPQRQCGVERGCDGCDVCVVSELMWLRSACVTVVEKPLANYSSTQAPPAETEVFIM